MKKLNREENELLKSVESGEWKSVPRLAAAVKRYREYAESTFKKNRRVNIRLSGQDLDAIQKRAIEEGMPYQTLISSLVHKYASGKLVERPSAIVSPSSPRRRRA
jgi:predicted DNA binding CopG/RHH family protein